MIIKELKIYLYVYGLEIVSCMEGITSDWLMLLEVDYPLVKKDLVSRNLLMFGPYQNLLLLLCIGIPFEAVFAVFQRLCRRPCRRCRRRLRRRAS